MYIGTRLHMFEIPDPNPGIDVSPEGWSKSSKSLNGGGRIRNSTGAQRTYSFEWNKRADQIRRLFDIADGVYDTEDGANPVYFISPDAGRWNVATQAHADPASAAKDVMPLTRKIRPTTVNTPANTLGYPAKSAVYDTDGTETFEKLWVPIPPGMVLWIGAHGSATGDAGVQVTPFDGAIAGVTDELTLLAVTSTTRVNTSYSSADYTGVEIQLVPDTGVLTYSGTIVQILPVGATPVPGDWIGGSGHSGCTFEGKPRQNAYFVDGDRTDFVVTATLKETTAWQ